MESECQVISQSKGLNCGGGHIGTLKEVLGWDRRSLRKDMGLFALKSQEQETEKYGYLKEIKGKV